MTQFLHKGTEISDDQMRVVIVGLKLAADYETDDIVFEDFHSFTGKWANVAEAEPRKLATEKILCYLRDNGYDWYRIFLRPRKEPSYAR